MAVQHMNQNVGRLTFLCRWGCCAMLAAPLLYWWSFAYKGDALILLVLALLSLVAGLVLFVNSIFCLVRYRDRGQFMTSTFFILVSVIGVLYNAFVCPVEDVIVRAAVIPWATRSALCCRLSWAVCLRTASFYHRSTQR
jgi:hypothetical protein